MNRMAIPFCFPHDDREDEGSVNQAQPADGRPRDVDEVPDDYESPDEDTGQYEQHYQRIEELMTSLYNVFRIVLLPPPPLRRRNTTRGSGRRRQQVVSAGEREVAGEPRGAVPRRLQRPTAAGLPAEVHAPESDGEGDGLRLREMAAEARRRVGRRRLSSRTVATETDEEPPRGSGGNCQLPNPGVAPAGARRSMSTSSTQCSYEDWAEAGGAGGSSVGDGEEEESEEEEDDVFVASRPGDAHPPPRPPSPPPPPPSSNPAAPGDSRPGGGGGGSLQSRRQRRKRSGGGSSSSGGGRQRAGKAEKKQTVCTPATPVSDKEGDPKMAAPRKAEILRKQRSIEEWDVVTQELRKITWEFSSTFKQVDDKSYKGKEKVGEKGGALSTLLSPLLPSASPGLWTLVAVCVGAQVIGRLW